MHSWNRRIKSSWSYSVGSGTSAGSSGKTKTTSGEAFASAPLLLSPNATSLGDGDLLVRERFAFGSAVDVLASAVLLFSATAAFWLFFRLPPRAAFGLALLPLGRPRVGCSALTAAPELLVVALSVGRTTAALGGL